MYGWYTFMAALCLEVTLFFSVVVSALSLASAAAIAAVVLASNAYCLSTTAVATALPFKKDLSASLSLS